MLSECSMGVSECDSVCEFWGVSVRVIVNVSVRVSVGV